MAKLNVGKGGGLAGGCAVGTEQCQGHCRPYQVPPGTLTYPCEPCPMCRVPCTVRYRPSYRPVFALPYLGPSQVCVHLPLPYSGTIVWYVMLSGTVRYKILPDLPFPIRGKARSTCTCPFPIRGQVGECISFPIYKQRPSHVVSVSIWSFAIWDQIRCFICLC